VATTSGEQRCGQRRPHQPMCQRGQLHPCVCHARSRPCRAGPMRTAWKD